MPMWTVRISLIDVTSLQLLKQSIQCDWPVNTCNRKPITIKKKILKMTDTNNEDVIKKIWTDINPPTPDSTQAQTPSPMSGRGTWQNRILQLDEQMACEGKGSEAI
jgi:hypothetical protein